MAAAFQASSQPGVLHQYCRRLVAFEHARPSANTPAKHQLIFVGGIGDGLLGVNYTTALAKSSLLPPDWSIAELTLLSSWNGWGAGSLQRDVREIAQAVDYFKSIRPAGSKIVLIGHSTGCQDALEYVSGKGASSRPALDGVILQAGVSDREASDLDPKHLESLKVAQQYKDAGRENDVLPLSAVAGLVYGQAPVTAYRWLSLLVPNGDDDYFSSDLSDEQIHQSFGAFKQTALLILFSGADEHVPKHVDSAKLVARWTKAVKDVGGFVDEENGGIVDGAHHNLNGDPDPVVNDFCQRVGGFLEKVASRPNHATASQL